ncbi:MAG: hypothetical protein VX294_02735 [Candidatus Latescibacterota bacterium]|nr:hypothetical protein [Candidatus Latescibacterota bacterium]
MINRTNTTLLVIILGVGLNLGCALSVSPTGSEDRAVTLEMAAYPNRISAEDSTATAEIWATVRMGGTPIADSVQVVFATTVGSISETGITRDGLVVATLTGPGDGKPQRAEVVAQALTVRDTIEVDFILSD